MSKRETIERIMACNPTARPEFLAEFSLDELAAYLRQLESVREDVRPSTVASRFGRTPEWSSARPSPTLGG